MGAITDTAVVTSRVAVKVIVACMVLVTVLVVIGAVRQSGGNATDPSVLVHEAQLRDEAGALAYEEEERERRYRETPGPPAPVRGWTP